MTDEMTKEDLKKVIDDVLKSVGLVCHKAIDQGFVADSPYIHILLAVATVKEFCNQENAKMDSMLDKCGGES